MYEIVGKIGMRVKSRYYTSDIKEADAVKRLEFIRLRTGEILELSVYKVGDAPINAYVQWIKDCARYGVYDCNDIPEFE